MKNCVTLFELFFFLKFSSKIILMLFLRYNHKITSNCNKITFTITASKTLFKNNSLESFYSSTNCQNYTSTDQCILKHIEIQRFCKIEHFDGVVITLVTPDKSAWINELQGLQQFGIHWGKILMSQNHVHGDPAQSDSSVVSAHTTAKYRLKCWKLWNDIRCRGSFFKGVGIIL